MEHHWLVRSENEGRTSGAAKQGYVLYMGVQSVRGVGFLVNKNIKGRMVEFRGDSSRVASLTIKINNKYYLEVVQVYAPTSKR